METYSIMIKQEKARKKKKKNTCQIRTSWTDQELYTLSRMVNHRVRLVGDQFVWDHCVHGKKWEPQVVEGFDRYNRLLHCWNYTVGQYKKELRQRQDNLDIKHYHDVVSLLNKLESVMKIRNNPKLKTKDKIKRTIQKLPDHSNSQIAELLQLSRQIVHKHRVEISRGNSSN